MTVLGLWFNYWVDRAYEKGASDSIMDVYQRTL